MNKNKLLILIILSIFCIGFSIGSVFAVDSTNSTDDLNSINYNDSNDNLKEDIEINSLEKLSKCGDSNEVGGLRASNNSTHEILSLNIDSSENNILSSSVSVSSGHTYQKCGYTFKVSANQYNQIKEAISAGKKHKFLDWGFDFKVKTNKVVKVKVLAKSKTYHKKVRYEGITGYPYNGIKLANLKNYYNKGWKKYFTGYESANGKSNIFLGYNYVKLKKTVKIYKIVKMRVYATISYVGEYDYEYGEHCCYPWVSFNALKRGYHGKYLGGTLLK